MPQKSFDTAEVGPVLVIKRRGARNLRLSFNASGQIRVSMPSWTPYAAGVNFAIARRSWIDQHRPTILTPNFKDGDRVGKSHVVEIKNGLRLGSRLTANRIVITTPGTVSPSELQNVITKAAERALRVEAEKLLPLRLAELAAKHGFSYKSVSIKRLSARWGSCTSDKRITLNLFLMQMPWELIDYVIIHELVHTQHLNHGPDFGDKMNAILPNAKKMQKAVRAYKTQVLAA